jgi:hypothetical protein
MMMGIDILGLVRRLLIELDKADSFEQRKHCKKELKLPEMTRKHWCQTSESAAETEYIDFDCEVTCCVGTRIRVEDEQEGDLGELELDKEDIEDIDDFDPFNVDAEVNPLPNQPRSIFEANLFHSRHSNES